MTRTKEDIHAEMTLMGECARLNQTFLPYREYVSALNTLAKEWLKTHDKLPLWWWSK